MTMSRRREYLLRIFWYGSSTFDAWLNIATSKIASRLFTIPQATAQMGLPSAIVIQLLQGAIGLWAQCVINVLYLKYKFKASSAMENRFVNKNTHTTQLHEVIGGLLGPRWKAVSLLFNSIALFCISSMQIVACSNIVYILNDKLDKRAWTNVFGAIFSLSIFVPSAHNYRIWSFIGITTSAFASFYLAGATLVHGKVSDFKSTTPHSYHEYYSGVSGCIILGHALIPVEIMDAMRKPQHYQIAYAYGTLYTLVTVMVPSIIMNHHFGDDLLKSPNSLLLLPSSKFRDAAAVTMLIHQFINFGMYSLAVYAIWEKLLRVHESPSYAKRTLSRVPVFLALWVTALALPFFGTINRLFDSTIVVWNFYVIPCAAYCAFFWHSDKRVPSCSLTRLGWVVDFSFNLGIILWVVIVLCGLGFWGDMDALLDLKGLQLFAKCFDC